MRIRNDSFGSRKSLVKAIDLDSLSCQKSLKDKKTPVFVRLLKTDISKSFSGSETFKVPLISRSVFAVFSI